VLDRLYKVTAEHAAAFRKEHGTGELAPVWATMLDTKGPEIRTAMLRDHQSIELEAGQPIIVQAVGDAYTSFEGYKTAEETRIGLSYAGLCQSMAPGKRILLADGTISIEVEEILSPTELRGRVLNSKKLGERKNCNLPGVKVDIPVLTPKDVDDLQNFACKRQMDFVAASFVQSAEDVLFIRRVLDEAGGKNIKIISKIENQAGLDHFDDILKYTDGVMVARGDLGMEIPSEKVALAQKLIITKCTIAGKFVVTATQMLESMISNPLPTRAEMTDVANAVFDGTDAVMLSGETANGEFPDEAVSTMAAIVTNAEHAQNNRSLYNFIRNHTSKPMSDAEAICSSAVQTVSCGSCADTRQTLVLAIALPLLTVRVPPACSGDGHGRPRHCAAHQLWPCRPPGGQVPPRGARVCSHQRPEGGPPVQRHVWGHPHVHGGAHHPGD
jgi:pyruvate kinase